MKKWLFKLLVLFLVGYAIANFYQFYHFQTKGIRKDSESIPVVQAVPVQPQDPDPMVAVLENFLASKKSPLASSAATFVAVAKEYRLPVELLPAIAGVESGFEMAGNTGDYNPFGYMCGGSPCAFGSFDEAIRTVGRTIGTGRAYAKYRESGSLFELAKVYNYVSPEDWMGKVEYFERRIK